MKINISNYLSPMKNCFLFAIALVFLLTSCSKESQLEVESGVHNPTQAENTLRGEETIIPKVTDGRLHFDTEEEFGDYVRQLMDADVAETSAMQADLGFTSFYTMINTPFNDNDPLVDPATLNNDATIIIDDHLLLTVLDPNLEMQVGDRIYRVQKNFAFSYAVGHYDQVEEFNANSNEYELPDEELYVINDHLSVAKHSTVELDERLWIFGYGWRTNAKHRSYGHHRNMKSVQWETNLFFYRSIGVKTKYEEKRGWWIFKVWQNVNTDYLEVNWDGQLKMKFSGSPILVYRSVSGTKKAYNKGVVSKVLFVEAGAGVTVGGGSNPNISGTITSVDFENLDSGHVCKRWGNTQYNDLSWIW